MLLNIAVILLIVTSPISSPQRGYSDPCATARTASWSDISVIGNRQDQSQFAVEINRISPILTRTKLASRYKAAPATKADIIIRVQEDRTVAGSETISFTVFDPDTNKQLYTETRDLVNLENDVNRLVAHFLEGPAREHKNKQDAETHTLPYVSKITCPEVPLYLNRAENRRVWRNLVRGETVTVRLRAGDEDVVAVDGAVGYLDHQCIE